MMLACTSPNVKAQTRADIRLVPLVTSKVSAQRTDIRIRRLRAMYPAQTQRLSDLEVLGVFAEDARERLQYARRWVSERREMLDKAWAFEQAIQAVHRESATAKDQP